jgi:hypothetical protein
MKTGRAMSGLVILGELLAPGCEGTPRDGDDDGAADADTDADTDADSDGDTDTGGDGCSEESRLVYVVDTSNTLRRFNPPSQTFETAGIINCQSGGSPYALSVSRDDRVFVLYHASFSCVGINAVNALDATCLGLTAFDCGEDGFDLFGMGTATAGPGSTEDTLYIGSTETLGSLDTETWEVTPIGPVENLPDMSGNANGELWAYFAWTDPPRVSRLDKDTAIEVETIPLPSLSSSGSFAFATWGGDFYLFYDAGTGSSDVFRIHDGALETYMEDIGFEIVGADSSTCAPVAVE